MEKVKTLPSLIKLGIGRGVPESSIASCVHTDGLIENRDLILRRMFVGFSTTGYSEGASEGKIKKRAECTKSQRGSPYQID
jgi:hypothetical protein